jgi:hypothetical protein
MGTDLRDWQPLVVDALDCGELEGAVADVRPQHQRRARDDDAMLQGAGNHGAHARHAAVRNKALTSLHSCQICSFSSPETGHTARSTPHST